MIITIVISLQYGAQGMKSEGDITRPSGYSRDCKGMRNSIDYVAGVRNRMVVVVEITCIAESGTKRSSNTK